MRPLLAFCLAASVAALSFAAAPPPKPPAEWLALIDRLGDEDADARGEAAKKLEALGEGVIPLLRRASKAHADIDVRLRAMTVAAATEKKLYGEVRRFTGHTTGVIAFALSPDGKRMASGSWGDLSEHVARIWDFATARELFKLEGHTSGVVCLAYSPDGKRILTGSTDGSARLWDATNGKHLKTLAGRGGGVHAVLFTPDGKKAVSCGSQTSVLVWDLEAGKALHEIEAHTASVRGLALMPGGKRVASASFDGTVRILDIESGKEVKRFDGKHAGGAWFVAVSPDGKRVASGGADHMVRLWDILTGKQLKEFSGHARPVHGVAYSHDGKRLLSAGASAWLWDIESGKVLQHLGEESSVGCVAFTGDDRHAVICQDRVVSLWKLRK